MCTLIGCTLSCRDSVHDVSFSQDGQHIAAACYDGVYIFSLNQQSQDFEMRSESPLRGHKDPVMSLCFSPCGTKIVSGGGEDKHDGGNVDFSIRVWDVKTGVPIGSPLRGHRYVPSLSRECFLSCFWY